MVQIGDPCGFTLRINALLLSTIEFLVGTTPVVHFRGDVPERIGNKTRTVHKKREECGTRKLKIDQSVAHPPTRP